MQLPSFTKRPPHTLLYITEDKTFRIDTDRKGIMYGEVQVLDISCESSNGLPTTIDSIISQSPIMGKKVWILYKQLNTYQLTLPAVQVAGVEDDILQQALQFEYEALTGNTLTNSQLAYHFLGTTDEMSSYWINIIATETLDAIKTKLKKARCTLGDLIHSGGFPGLLSATDDSSWLRVECWSNAVFAIAKTPEQGLSLQIFSAEKDSDWRQQVEQWMLDIGSADKSEAVMNQDYEYLPDTDESFHLTLDGALVFWLGQWAQYLITEKQPNIPLLNKKASINMELVYIIGGGVIAAFLCASHALWLIYQTNEYIYQTEQLTKTEKDLKGYRDGINKSRDKLSTLQKQVDTLGGNINVIPSAIKGLQQRPAELLKHLSLASPEDVVIEEVKTVGAQIIVSGVTLEANLSNILAGKIEAPMLKVGWKVTPPTKKQMSLFSNGGPWSFEMIIEDLGLQGFVKE